MSNGDIRLLADTLIVETVLGNPSFIKKAGTSEVLSGIISTIQSYVGEHIDQNDKVGSVLNILSPVGIFSLFGRFNFTRIGILLGLAISIFHIDVGSIIESMYNFVKDRLSQGKTITPAEIDAAAQNAVQEHTPQESDQMQANTSLAQKLTNARWVRLAMEDYDYQLFRLTKEAAPMAASTGRAARIATVLGSILSWIFKVILISTGFMVVGDLANKLMGRPNALDHTWQAGQSGSSSSLAPVPISTQTKFKPNPGQDAAQPHPWVVNVPNNADAIENMLVNMTKQVYSGLDGKEDIIRSSPTFQAVKDQIIWYNHAAVGEPFIYIPGLYPSKKALVDHFIDEVARNSP
jgi:hypothetical protein